MSSAIRQLLAPVGEQTFFDEYWEKRSLHLRGAADRLPFTFGRADFFAALAGSPVVKIAYRDGTGQHRECPVTAEQAPKLYEAGMSICGAHLEGGDARLKHFIAQLDAGLTQAGAFHLNGYLSPADKGFGVHFDNHSVWILQMEGSKRWFYSETPEVPYPLTNLIYPLRQDTFRLPWYTVARPDRSTFTEVVLEPGDVLYLPAGAWHETQAGSYSLSLTLAQEPVYAAQFVADLLRAGCLHRLSGRRFLPGQLPGADTDAARQPLLEAFEACLATMRTALDGLTPERLCRMWEAQAAASRKTPAAGDGAATPAPAISAPGN